MHLQRCPGRRHDFNVAFHEQRSSSSAVLFSSSRFQNPLAVSRFYCSRCCDMEHCRIISCQVAKLSYFPFYPWWNLLQLSGNGRPVGYWESLLLNLLAFLGCHFSRPSVQLSLVAFNVVAFSSALEEFTRHYVIVYSFAMVNCLWGQHP